jgi:hypothetical protein
MEAATYRPDLYYINTVASRPGARRERVVTPWRWWLTYITSPWRWERYKSAHVIYEKDAFYGH